MIQTQAVLNQKVECLIKQYNRLPLLLATGDIEEKVELQRWGRALAAAVGSWKGRIIRPSSLRPEEMLDYLSAHLRLQVQNKWDELWEGDPFVPSGNAAKVAGFAEELEALSKY